MFLLFLIILNSSQKQKIPEESDIFNILEKLFNIWFKEDIIMDYYTFFCINLLLYVLCSF